jgi:photosystem II stability/assembly factor-like uncharacterized protein
MYPLLVVLFTLLYSTPHWEIQKTGVTARLRGISAISAEVAWASGSGGTVLRTSDGGETWKRLSVTSEALDFRDIDAIDERTAYVLSIGNGAASRIYKTIDAGASWTLQFKNDDEKAFLDAMSFSDRDHGLLIGDSINGQLYILRTENGGKSWLRLPASGLPPALENEGAFAASGTNIAMVGTNYAWIGTGAAAMARVLRTTDGGRSWQVATTPLQSGPSAGIFSIAFRDRKHGVAVGGDYKKETSAEANLAFTKDGGASWQLGKGLTGFRSVVTYVGDKLVAIGPSGADYSSDDGKTWTAIPGAGFDTFSNVSRLNVGWASGSGGRIAKLVWQ